MERQRRADVFVDGVSSIQIVDGAARLEFYALLAAPADAEGRPPAAPRLRLVMAPETLGEMHAAMRDLVDQLVAIGVVQRALAPQEEGANV
jgi:hypothetical protein